MNLKIPKQNLIYIKVRENIYLIIILLAALFLRINSVVENGIGETIDSHNYIKQAYLLVHGGYSLYFPNGFPLIISLFIPLKEAADLSIILVILNIILSVFTVYMVYSICSDTFKDKIISLTAALLIAVYPNQIKYVHWVLSEVPSAFFITLSLFLFVKKKYALAGAAIGFASMIRTTLLPVGIFFTLYLLIKKGFPSYKYLAFYALVPLLFLTYGFIRTGSFTIGQNAAHNLTITTEYSDTSSFPKVHLKNLDGSFKDYVSYAFESPAEFIQGRIENLWDLWAPLPPLETGLRWNSKFFWTIGIRFILLVLAIIGFIKLDKNPVVVFSFLAIGVITVVHFFYFADPRFTYTIEPFAIILASAGTIEMAKNILLKRKQS